MKRVLLKNVMDFYTKVIPYIITLERTIIIVLYDYYGSL